MLGQALKSIREMHNLSVTQAAAELSLSKAHISEIENDKKTPSLETIQKYADVFGIPASNIMFFSEQLNENEGGTRRKTRLFLSKKILNLLNRL